MKENSFRHCTYAKIKGHKKLFLLLNHKWLEYMEIMCGYLMTTGTIIMHEEATSKKS